MSRPALPSPSDLEAVPVAELPALLAHLAALQTAIAARMAQAPAATPAPAGPERLLDAREAAARCGMSADYLYRHARTLPFTRRLGRAVRFSESGLVRWLATRGR